MATRFLALLVKDCLVNMLLTSNDRVVLVKVAQLNDELQRKETKWAAVVTKLQEQVKLLEKENQHLHQENHKLKLKGVSSKVRKCFCHLPIVRF